MAEVRLQEGETLENALRRFKRKVLQEDIIKEVKRHAFYLKPGQKRRVKAGLRPQAKVEVSEVRQSPDAGTTALGQPPLILPRAYPH